MTLFPVSAAGAVDLLAKTDGEAATPATTTPARRRNSRRFVSSLRTLAILFTILTYCDLLAMGLEEARTKRKPNPKAFPGIAVPGEARGTADPSAPPDFLFRVAASVGCVWFSLGRTT
jgi:hypothetical protein